MHTTLIRRAGPYVAVLFLAACDAEIRDLETADPTMQLGAAVVIPSLSLRTVAPNSGSALGGTAVTLTGTGFLAGARVYFDTEEAQVSALSPNEIRVTAPSHAPGVVDVKVRNSNGHEAVKSQAFKYTPALTRNTGLFARYFDNADFTGPAVTRIDGTVAFDWSTGSPAPGIAPDSFTVRWTGRITPEHTEKVTFHVTGDDGIRLWVDGVLLVDDWNVHPPTESSATLFLSAGQDYAIRVDFWENDGGALAKLEWSSPSIPRQVVPSRRLTPVDAPPPGTIPDPLPPGDPAAAADIVVGFLKRTPEIPFENVPNVPAPGSTVTWTAHLRNPGTAATGPFDYRFYVDGQCVASGRVQGLAPGASGTASFDWPWNASDHAISFWADPGYEVSEKSERNNVRVVRNNALMIGVWIEQSFANALDGSQYAYQARWNLGDESNSYEDWFQRMTAKWNEYLGECSYPSAPRCGEDRVRLQKIVVVPDGALPLNGGISAITPTPAITPST